MKKKVVSLLVVGAMAAGLTACGGGAASTSTASTPAASTSTASEASTSTASEASTSTASEASTSASEQYGAIRLLNGKPEIDDQLQDLAKKYKEETGNEVTIETIGGDTSASDALTQMYQADNMPDIFVVEANQVPNWDGMLADLSGSAWIDDTAYELTDDEMGVVGFPYTVEATALAFNADLLDKADIDPADLTSPSAWQKACEKLDGMKDELGITAVFGWCAEPSNLGWSSGTHVFAQYLDAGLAQDDTTYIDMLNDGGKIDADRMLAFAEFIGMMNKYSDPELLVDGTYDNQVAGFAEGKYVFVTQGNWINTSVTGNENYNGFKMGFAPYAFEDGIDTIIAGPPSYWTVYKDGDVDAAKAFLEWVDSDTAQDILVNEAGLISPFDSCTYTPTDPFAEHIQAYMHDGKTSGWHTMLKKAGLENKTCQVFADYAKGTIADAQGFVDTISGVIEAYYAE